jgi:hypothetical protein
MSESNIYEIKARQNKVAKLVATFQRTTNGSAFNVSMLDPLGWQLAERAAGVKPASAETRQEVIKTLQEAEDYRAAMFNTVMGGGR